MDEHRTVEEIEAINRRAERFFGGIAKLNSDAETSEEWQRRRYGRVVFPITPRKD